MSQVTKLVTLFTNPTCHLCTRAKDALRAVQSNTQETYRLRVQEVDITDPTAKDLVDLDPTGASKFSELYQFDVPVIHFSQDGKSKLMHWIYEESILEKLAESQGPREYWKTTMGKKRDGHVY